MFVASNLYRYATGTGTPAATTSTANTRVKRRPNKRPVNTTGLSSSLVDDDDGDVDADADVLGTSPPPSYASVASGSTPEEQKQANEAKYAIIESILAEEDLYKLLGIKKTAKVDEIRRGFLNRSRVCHPDKFQNYPPATEAFQKVSFAYEILSKPTSRRMYDVSGRTNYAAAMNNGAGAGPGGEDGTGLADDTLNGVLYSVFCEFLEGDFEMIRVMVNALNEGNPSMNLGDDAVDSIEGAFRRLREALLAGRRYLSIIKFELMRLYEIQQSLRQLSYFNITGRLKLTLQLARVTINIPLAIDQAMKTGGGPNAAQEEGEYVSSSESDSDPEDAVPKRRRSSGVNEGNADADFGVAPEPSRHDVEEDEDSDSAVHSESLAEERARARRRARRARKRAAKREKRARLRGEGVDTSGQQPPQQQQQLQRRGLLPQTAVGLLKGVVMVLETSEGWMPGAGVSADPK